jgi:hypothetical protein
MAEAAFEHGDGSKRAEERRARCFEPLTIFGPRLL